MKALIDYDIFLHEIGWSSQFKDKDTGEDILLDWDRVQELVDDKIRVINVEVGADEPPILFLSNSQWLTDSVNRERRLYDEPKEFVPNFRLNIAKTKPYKGTRKQEKPYHFYNIIAYGRSEYETIISQDGYEADDEMAIYQVEANKNGLETTICSRDKDLRMVPGLHYSWECGKQRSIGPEYTDELGRLELTDKGKLLGYGALFFYSQLLTGDTVDNITGLEGCGPVRAFKELEGSVSTRDAFLRVRRLYQDKLGPEAFEEYFLEQANLLWIVRERGKGYEGYMGNK